MDETRLIGIALVIVLGIAAQWLAWRTRLPSILLLLLTGFFAGPIFKILDPDFVFGGLLFPLVSICVAIILFEGGLTLRLRELPNIGNVLWRLLSIGALVTWFIGTLGAHYLVGLRWNISLLLGAILVVTGPTVIGPLLRHVRPVKRVASILNWEGIVIDPIGAVLAVIVFEAILPHEGAILGWQGIALSVGKTVVYGVGVGAAAGWVLTWMLKRFWIPDNLQNPAALAAVVGAFALSNHLQAESGLIAVTLMGVYLANQQAIVVKHIVEFKENIRVLLISGLFILLSARLDVADLKQIGFGSFLFFLVMVVIARPLSVWVSTVRSQLKWGERLFLMWMAPRGIVAASVASIFALRLIEEEVPGAEALVPVTVVIIVGTVALYGLTASLVAAKLKIAKPRPNGVLILGAHDWARKIGLVLKKAGIPVMLVDTNVSQVSAARLEGLTAQHTSILSETAWEAAEDGEYGRLLALTRNDEVNALACIQFIEIFGRAGVFQLAPKRPGHVRHEAVSPHHRGRMIFDKGTSWTQLNEAFAKGATIKTTKLTAEFDYNDFRGRHGLFTIPLFLINDKNTLHVMAPDTEAEPSAGDILISLVAAEKAGELLEEKIEKKTEKKNGKKGTEPRVVAATG